MKAKTNPISSVRRKSSDLYTATLTTAKAVIPAPFFNGVNSSRNPAIFVGSGLRLSPE
jgi:hypothetical protein